LNRENVIITPHIAFDNAAAVERILETTVDNIIEAWPKTYGKDNLTTMNHRLEPEAHPPLAQRHGEIPPESPL